MPNPVSFRYFKASPEIIQLVVMLYMRILSVGYLSVDCLSLMISGAGSGNRTRTLSLEGSYDTISPYPLTEVG